MTEPTDRDIIALAAVSGMVTGEGLHKDDGYYFRSIGSAANVRDADLVAFARRVREWDPLKCIQCGGSGVLGGVASQRFFDCPDCGGTGRAPRAANDADVLGGEESK